MEITPEIISPYMASRLISLEKKAVKSTIVQCYHAKQILLITPLVKFYLERGLKVTNITKFTQYVPAKCFKPFTKKVFDMRCQADRAKDKTKATTAKLFGNSAYGKTGQVYSYFNLI